MSRVLAVAIALGLAAGLVGCDSKGSSSGGPTDAQKKEMMDKMKQSQENMKPGGGGAAPGGTGK